MVQAIRAQAGFPLAGHGFAGNLKVAWGSYVHTTNLPATTVIEYCRVPKGATIIGGWWAATDLDTGTETLDIDLGWAANGDEAADPDGFGNLGVITGDPAAHIIGGVWIPLQGILLSSGPKTFNAATTITAVINVEAATGGTGRSSLYALYTMP